MNLTQEQLNWLNNRKVRIEDAKEDKDGVYVEITSTMGDKSKLYI